MTKQAKRAILITLWTLLTGLAVYQGVPTSLDQLWQPMIAALLAGVGALGINMGTRTR